MPNVPLGIPAQRGTWQLPGVNMSRESDSPEQASPELSRRGSHPPSTNTLNSPAFSTTGGSALSLMPSFWPNQLEPGLQSPQDHPSRHLLDPAGRP